MTSSSNSQSCELGGQTLQCLVAELSRFNARLIGAGSVRVTDVQQDSRRVKPGDLFVARTGGHVDGGTFVEAAIRNGAVAILTNEGSSVATMSPVPVICVSDPRRALAFAAESVQGHPSSHLPVVGITGTNGKTTTVALVERALAAVGARPARLGTTGFAFGPIDDESSLTTPEADEISRLIGRVSRSGGTHFIMEASSHALDQGRVDALRFDVAAFTNLTQDHLDHHGNMERYEAAKRRLFVDLEPRRAVINLDNETGVRFARESKAGHVISVGRGPKCDVHPGQLIVDAQGIHGELHVANKILKIATRLMGEHNLENLLLAVGILSALDVDLQSAVDGLSGDYLGAPGRLERCEGPDDDVIVLVDYAHTPDALERALQAVKKLAQAKVICIFGCGGDRDPNKRPKMGYAVGRWADDCIVTNDNPRTEDPEAIADAILPGLREAKAHYRVMLDRAVAIEQGILGAKPGDVILIAGKGHEPYQIIGTTKRPFDDREQAKLALAARRAHRAHAEGQ